MTGPLASCSGPSDAAIESLTRFQRILLASNGTVTHLLAAYAGEPIEVVKLFQEYDRSTAVDAALDVGTGVLVLRRRVVLRGSLTKGPLLYAEAAVVPDRVPASVLDGVLSTDEPIGALLLKARVETLRELLLTDREPAGACGPLLGVGPSAPLIVRTYRIVAGRRPIMLITEKFPATSFRQLLE